MTKDDDEREAVLSGIANAIAGGRYFEAPEGTDPPVTRAFKAIASGRRTRLPFPEEESPYDVPGLYAHDVVFIGEERATRKTESLRAATVLKEILAVAVRKEPDKKGKAEPVRDKVKAIKEILALQRLLRAQDRAKAQARKTAAKKRTRTK
jgi:hypothetical protein